MTEDDEMPQRPPCRLGTAIEWARLEVQRRQAAGEWAAAEQVAVLKLAAETLHVIAKERRVQCDG